MEEQNDVKWTLQNMECMNDLVVLSPNASINRECENKYPRIAVDQHAASAIMRGADLMAVGVIGIDCGRELVKN